MPVIRVVTPSTTLAVGNRFLTFTPSLFQQTEAGGTQALVTDLQVITDMRAASVVVQTLVRFCGFGNELINTKKL